MSLGVDYMKIETGYLYHIKDKFFDIVNDEKLMTNHERGKKRPTYFTIKDGDILWFIPLSSKVNKYKKIIDKKIEKYGVCNTILIHTVDGKPAKVPEKLEKIILENFENLIKLKKRGIDLFFTDIDKIKI